MFWSSNKKVFWKDLWSSGFIDMHNHLLWGLDDGAKTFEETMLLCEMMQELGVTSAITTPHRSPRADTPYKLNGVYHIHVSYYGLD